VALPSSITNVDVGVYAGRWGTGTDSTVKFGEIAIYEPEKVGTPTISRGAVNITGTGIASLETFGTAVVGRGAVTITNTGIASTEAFGTLTISVAAAGFDAINGGTASTVGANTWDGGSASTVGTDTVDGGT
jgi:hypothetical protein